MLQTAMSTHCYPKKVWKPKLMAVHTKFILWWMTCHKTTMMRQVGQKYSHGGCKTYKSTTVLSSELFHITLLYHGISDKGLPKSRSPSWGSNHDWGFVFPWLGYDVPYHKTRDGFTVLHVDRDGMRIHPNKTHQK